METDFYFRPGAGDARALEKASRLLAEAGYPEGRGFPKLEILYNTADTHQAIAELIQSQWKRELGIDVGLVNQEWPSYLNSRRLGQYDVARAGWIGDYVDRRSRNTTTNTATPIVRNTAVMPASSITSGSDARGERHEALMTWAAVR